MAAPQQKAGDVVPDIGCGSGYYTRWLAKAVGGAGGPPRTTAWSANRASDIGMRAWFSPKDQLSAKHLFAKMES